MLGSHHSVFSGVGGLESVSNLWIFLAKLVLDNVVFTIYK